MKRLNVPTLSEECYNAIKQRILSGEIRPGEKINLEQSALLMGVSATPVREALLKLQQEGMAEYTPRAGWRIPLLSRSTYLKYYEVQRLLEITLSIQTKPLIKSEHIVSMEKTNETMKKIAEYSDKGRMDVEELLRENDKFHMLMYGLYPNTVMLDILQQVWNTTKYQRWLMVTSDSYVKRFYSEHVAIIEALKIPDDSILLKAMHKHFESAMADLEKEFEEKDSFSTSWIKYPINTIVNHGNPF